MLALGSATARAQTAAEPELGQDGSPARAGRDYTHSAKAFPSIFSPYKSDPIEPLQLENSPQLMARLRDGRLQLSLSDALGLALENNLDIAVQRYVRPIAQVDVLRASSGQAARGVPGALLPSGLSAGALGVGVNQAGGTGGVGGAGGISGGGGAVSVPQVGTFDPAVSLSTSYDRTAAPLNSLVVAGVPQVTTLSSATSVNYTQLFAEGSSFTLTVNGIAQSSTQQSLLFNPAVVSRLAVGFNQPLLNGFGTLPNKRFLLVAANNMKTSDELFRAQVTSTVVQVENTYWDLEAAGQAIAAAQRASDAALRFVEDTKIRIRVGTVAGVDLASAESAAAAAKRDLIVAQTTFQLLQAQLKNLISKERGPALDAAEIETTDPFPDPDGWPIPDMKTVVSEALANRSELRVAEQDLDNQAVSVRFTHNGLLPTVSAFALYAGAGLTGDTVQASRGLGTSLSQVIDADYPEYAGGLSATVALRNRAAQADNLRARLEQQQLTVQLQRLRQEIGLEVQQAVISLLQGKAQIGATREALALAEQIAQAEREKLELGVSTAYDVVLRERDLLAARQADVAASAAFAKALVDLERATGATLDRNGIKLADALTGTVPTLSPSVLPVAAASGSGAGSKP